MGRTWPVGVPGRCSRGGWSQPPEHATTTPQDEDPERRPHCPAARAGRWRRLRRGGYFIVTGHRSLGAAPFGDLSLVVPGDRVQVRRAVHPGDDHALHRATPVDHAAGNFWSDRFHSPEDRIDQIGVLVATQTVRPPAPRGPSASG